MLAPLRTCSAAASRAPRPGARASGREPRAEPPRAPRRPLSLRQSRRRPEIRPARGARRRSQQHSEAAVRRCRARLRATRQRSPPTSSVRRRGGAATPPCGFPCGFSLGRACEQKNLKNFAGSSHPSLGLSVFFLFTGSPERILPRKDFLSPIFCFSHFLSFFLPTYHKQTTQVAQKKENARG